MTRESIQLNPEKVKFYIDRSGYSLKQLIPSMSPKTVHRIKAGKNTTSATAIKLATKLGIAVDKLSGPITIDETDAFMPEHWLYDEVAAPSGIPKKKYPPCRLAIGGGQFLVGPSPTTFKSPIDELIEWRESTNRKIVLRREGHAFVIAIHHFDYSPDHAQTVVHQTAMACRFFPLARNGDTFKMTGLDDWQNRYVWNWLKEKALANAEIVEFEGQDGYPDHPRAYFPLVRFNRGMAIRRSALGARVFNSQYDFRESLLAYLKAIPANRVQARTTISGIAITVKPVRPTVFNPEWWDDELEFKVNLAWRQPDGTLALAPWRQTSREQFIKGIGSRDWRDMHLRHMPLGPFLQDDEEDPGIPLFEADPTLSAETLAFIETTDQSAYPFGL
jgi:hypothetical protein